MCFCAIQTISVVSSCINGFDSEHKNCIIVALLTNCRMTKVFVDKTSLFFRLKPLLQQTSQL